MGTMDQGIKRLVQSHPQDVLALVLPDVEVVGPLALDVATEPQLVLDTLVRIRYKGEECAVDLEAEARPQADIGKRLHEYASRASIVTGLLVISVVLWLEPGGTPPTSPYIERVADLEVSTRSFFGIELYRVPAATLLERGLIGLLPLVPFAQGGGEAGAVERAAEIIKERAQVREEMLELEGLLAVFGARTLGEGGVNAIMRRVLMSTEILETSPLYWSLVNKGRQEGRDEGLDAGVRDATLAALRGRFAPLSAEVEQAVATASRDALLALLAHVATDSLDDVRARLGL